MKHFVLIILFVLLPTWLLAAVNVPWSTTYDCPEWTAFDTLNCDGWSFGLGTGIAEKITSTANYPSGGGGRGQMKTVRDGTGTAPHSGGLSLAFNTPQTHIFIRWYMKFDANWTTNWNSWKVIYLYDSAGDPGYIQLGYPGVNGARMFGGGDIDSSQQCSNCAYDIAFSEDEWVLMEVEIDIGTAGVADGNAKWWINENLIIDASNINWNSLGNVDNILFTSNIKDVSNGQEVYVYLDDVSIDTSYIGPVTGTSEPIRSNASPTSVLDTGTTSTTMSLSTDTSSTCKYGTVADTAYASIANTFSTTGGTTHSQSLTGLTNGSSTTYYIRCDNGVSNTTDYQITVEVADPTSDPQPPTPDSLLLSENFENDSWASRGWYDGVSFVTGSTAGGQSGNALKWAWATGETKPTNFQYAIRQNISYPVTEFYVKWYEYYEAGWQGSGGTSHPHVFYFMSEDDGIYDGPATSNSTIYLESTVDSGTIYGRIAHQDKLRTNMSEGSVPNDLSSTTETRSANHCNTPYTSVGAEYGVCYSSTPVWYSANIWEDQAAAIPSGEWVKREAYIKLNTFTGGVANYDGVLQTWINGTIDTNESSVLWAAGEYEGKGHRQFVIGPYIGAGSPTDQTMWVDGLEVWSVGSSNVVCYKDVDGDLISDGRTEVVSTCSTNYYLDAALDYLTGDCDDNNASVGLCTVTRLDPTGTQSLDPNGTQKVFIVQ